MHPIIFKFGPLTVYSYGLLVAAAFIVGTYLAKVEAERENIPPEKIVNLSLVLAISAILGARLFYVLQNLTFYLDYPRQILLLHRGGLSFYGGFFLAIISAAIFVKRQGLNILRTFDIVCPYLALGQAIGRIGCFLNGCCYGKPTNTGLFVHFPGQNITRHPVQIYASLNLLLIFIILRAFSARRKSRPSFSGQIFLLYCLLYSASRFFMEYLRGDNLPIVANLTVHQLISAAIFIIASLIWWRKWSIH